MRRTNSDAERDAAASRPGQGTARRAGAVVRVLVAAAGLATSGLALGVSVAAAATDPALDQEIAEDQQVAEGRAVLAQGHADIGPRVVDGEWTLMVHDDTASPPVWRRMDDAVFQVSDAAVLTVPEDPAYAFLPAPSGSEVLVVPQAQHPDVVWVGWNTQDPAVMESVDRGVTLSLRGVQGPGDLVVFLQSGTLGDPEVLWDSREPSPQDVWVEVNTHTHANWVFSEPGVYLVEVGVTADLVTGETESGTELLRFAVGDATSTDDAFTAEYAAAGTEPSGTVTSSADGAGDETAAGGPPVGLLAGAGGAVALAVAVAVVAGRGRRAKREAARSGRTGESAGDGA